MDIVFQVILSSFRRNSLYLLPGIGSGLISIGAEMSGAWVVVLATSNLLLVGTLQVSRQEPTVLPLLSSPESPKHEF